MFNSAYQFMHSSKIKERLNIVNSAGVVVGWLDPWDGVFNTQLLVLENVTKFLVYTIQSQLSSGKALLPTDIHEWLQPALADRKLRSGQFDQLRFAAAYVGKPHVQIKGMFYSTSVDYQTLYKVYPTKGLVYEADAMGRRQLGLLCITKHGGIRQETLYANCNNLTIPSDKLRTRFKSLLAAESRIVVKVEPGMIGSATIPGMPSKSLIQEF